MIARKWEVVSICRTCQLIMLVDLRVIVLARGPDVSLWNRKARCRRLLCGGVVEFHAKVPGMDQHEPLRADDRLDEHGVGPEPEWIRKAREHARNREGLDPE